MVSHYTPYVPYYRTKMNQAQSACNVCIHISYATHATVAQFCFIYIIFDLGAFCVRILHEIE